MKKLVVFPVLLLTCITAFAQSDTSRIEQYCTVIATPRAFSTRVTIDIDYGERRSTWKDNRLKEEDGTLKKFNTVVDALNYMGKNGWQLVNAFPVNVSSNSFNYHYIFRKKFLRSETGDTE